MSCLVYLLEICGICDYSSGCNVNWCHGYLEQYGWIIGSAFPVGSARVALLGLCDTGLEPSWLT